MTKSESKTPADREASDKAPPVRREEGIRDTVEAIAIAFILAFIFKTYEAEAFVIPTGSMAPTLFGRHKEVECAGCGLPYPIGASQEIDQDSGLLQHRVRSSSCPNCRFVNDVLDAPVFNGDRIVVNKQVNSWERFNVVVFRNPEEPHINYIKRLIGLPGETIRLRQGDVYARRSADDPWQIQRKQDFDRQLAIQIPVYDDRYPPNLLLDAGAEERWVPSIPVAPAAQEPDGVDFAGWPAAANAWQDDRQERSFSIASESESANWLRYRHLIPSAAQLQAAANGTRLQSPLAPELITDFCGFNAESGNSDQGRFWISDLTLRFNLQVTDIGNAEGLILIELVEGMRSVQCRIRPADGNIQLVLRSAADVAADPVDQVIAEGQTEISAGEEYQICFANVDDRLLLWIDGDVVQTDRPAEFSTQDLNLPSNADLAPAGIAVSGGLSVKISELQLLRDIYYRNDLIIMSSPQQVMANPYTSDFNREYQQSAVEEHISPLFQAQQSLSNCLRSPAAYAIRYAEIQEDLEAEYGDELYFALADDEYLMLGDNSPASKDSRLFDQYSRPMRGIRSNRYAVRATDLIGEAMFIFWPHGVPFLNGGRGYGVMGHGSNGRNPSLKPKEYPLYRFPFYPDLSRMKQIR